MSVSRRRFLEMLTAAGASIPAGHWIGRQMEAYARERLAYEDVRGPGIASFSRTLCRDCANHCSLAVRKVDGLPVGIRGTPWDPTCRGGLCVAGQSQMQALFDPDRLRDPILREDAGEPGRPAEWPEARGMLEEKIGALVARGAGDRLVVVDGRTPSLGTKLLESWVRSIPGARYIPLRVEAAMDRLARGLLRGAPGGRLAVDVEHAGALLLAGFEMLEVDGSPVSQMRAHAERRESARHAGAPTIYLGPRQGATAAKADLWLPCRPEQERDILLALAESLARKTGARPLSKSEYTRWIPEARDEVEFARKFSPENLGRRLGVKREDLEMVRDVLLEHSPALVLPGPGLLRRSNGAAGANAAFALNFWTGGFRAEGGISWRRDPLEEIAAAVGLPASREEDSTGLLHVLQPLLEIKRSPVDVLICVEANLVHEMPGHDMIARALSHVPFLASFSVHEDETSQVAHVTVPVPLSLECWDIPAPAWGVPEARLHVQRPAVVPVFDVPCVEDHVLELAGLGVKGESFDPPAGSAKELVEKAAAALVALKRGMLHTEKGARSMSEVSPSSARKALLAGEGAWVDEPREAPSAGRGPARITPAPRPLVDLAPGQFWLVPFDGAAIHQGRLLNRPMMMELSGMWHGIGWESWLEIHPDDAHRLGIISGGHVRVRGPRAEIVCTAVVTRSVDPGVVAAPVGFGHRAMGRVARGHGASVMDLPNTRVDEGTETPAWGPIPVFLDKA